MEELREVKKLRLQRQTLACFTSVPRLLQGSSGRRDTMASCTHCRGPVGLEWPSPTPSLGNKSELPVLPTRTHSSLHSPLHSQPAASQALSKSRAVSQHAFLAIRASTDISGLQVTQSKAAAPLKASLLRAAWACEPQQHSCG